MLIVAAVVPQSESETLASRRKLAGGCSVTRSADTLCSMRRDWLFVGIGVVLVATAAILVAVALAPRDPGCQSFEGASSTAGGIDGDGCEPIARWVPERTAGVLVASLIGLPGLGALGYGLRRRSPI